MTNDIKIKDKTVCPNCGGTGIDCCNCSSLGFIKDEKCQYCGVKYEQCSCS